MSEDRSIALLAGGWRLAWRSGSSVRHLNKVKLCRAWLVSGFDGILICFGEHLAWPSWLKSVASAGCLFELAI